MTAPRFAFRSMAEADVQGGGGTTLEGEMEGETPIETGDRAAQARAVKAECRKLQLLVTSPQALTDQEKTKVKLAALVQRLVSYDINDAEESEPSDPDHVAFAKDLAYLTSPGKDGEPASHVKRGQQIGKLYAEMLDSLVKANNPGVILGKVNGRTVDATAIAMDASGYKATAKQRKAGLGRENLKITD